MSAIPPKLRAEMDAEPYYHRCARRNFFHDHKCQPDPMTHRLIEWEHAMYWSGRKIQERWAIIPSCWWAHRGPGLDKRKNEMLALARATDDELRKYAKATWARRELERRSKT